MKQQIQKNNVSYFEAGFKAAMMIFGGITKEEVERRFYSTLLYPNMMRECLRQYDLHDDDTSGSALMLDNL